MGRKKSDKKLECLECSHCKTRVFRSEKDLLSWCGRKSIKPNTAWVREIADFGWLRLIWCELQTDQYNPQGFSPRNASPRYTIGVKEKLKEKLKKEKKSVLVSNRSKKPFISNAEGICPFESI